MPLFVSLLIGRLNDACVFIGASVDANSDRTVGFASFVRRHVLRERSLKAWHGSEDGLPVRHTIMDTHVMHLTQYTERTGIYWVSDSPCSAVEMDVDSIQFREDDPLASWSRWSPDTSTSLSALDARLEKIFVHVDKVNIPTHKYGRLSDIKLADLYINMDMTADYCKALNKRLRHLRYPQQSVDLELQPPPIEPNTQMELENALHGLKQIKTVFQQAECILTDTSLNGYDHVRFRRAMLMKLINEFVLVYFECAPTESVAFEGFQPLKAKGEWTVDWSMGVLRLTYPHVGQMTDLRKLRVDDAVAFANSSDSEDVGHVRGTMMVVSNDEHQLVCTIKAGQAAALVSRTHIPRLPSPPYTAYMCCMKQPRNVDNVERILVSSVLRRVSTPDDNIVARVFEHCCTQRRQPNDLAVARSPVPPLDADIESTLARLPLNDDQLDTARTVHHKRIAGGVVATLGAPGTGKTYIEAATWVAAAKHTPTCRALIVTPTNLLAETTMNTCRTVARVFGVCTSRVIRVAGAHLANRESSAYGLVADLIADVESYPIDLRPVAIEEYGTDLLLNDEDKAELLTACRINDEIDDQNWAENEYQTVSIGTTRTLARYLKVRARRDKLLRRLAKIFVRRANVVVSTYDYAIQSLCNGDAGLFDSVTIDEASKIGWPTALALATLLTPTGVLWFIGDANQCGLDNGLRNVAAGLNSTHHLNSVLCKCILRAADKSSVLDSVRADSFLWTVLRMPISGLSFANTQLYQGMLRSDIAEFVTTKYPFPTERRVHIYVYDDGPNTFTDTSKIGKWGPKRAKLDHRVAVTNTREQDLALTVIKTLTRRNERITVLVYYIGQLKAMRDLLQLEQDSGLITLLMRSDIGTGDNGTTVVARC
ncbi:unnamed protein product [Sphagnum balticum]